MVNTHRSGKTFDSLGKGASVLALAFLLSLPVSSNVAFANGPTPVPNAPLPKTDPQLPIQPLSAVNTNATGSANTAGTNAAGTANGAGGHKRLKGEVSHLHKAHRPQVSAVSSTAKHRQLDRAPLLLSPLEDVVVDTPFGTVSVKKGSVVLIIATDKELAVYNLHDTCKDAVVMDYHTDTVAIMPERVAVLAKSSLKSFQEVNPVPFVAYRQLINRDASSEMKLYQAEFDFGSMAHGFPALRKLMAEKIGPTQKSMGGMLKTAAIMTQLSQSSEPYGYYVTDKVRALSAAAKP